MKSVALRKLFSDLESAGQILSESSSSKQSCSNEARLEKNTCYQEDIQRNVPIAWKFQSKLRSNMLIALVS